MKHLFFIILGIAVSFESFASEYKKTDIIEIDKDYSSFLWLYKYSIGQNFNNITNEEPSNVNGALLDLTANTFGLTGTFKKHEIIGLFENAGLGIFRYNSKASGYISSVGLGNSETLFDSVIVKSSLSMEQEGLGISVYLPQQHQRKKLPQTNLFASYSKSKITHNTQLKAGAINSNVSNRKSFNDFSLGYQQKIELFEEGFFNPSLDFSRSFSIFRNSYDIDQVSVGLSLNFDPYYFQTVRNAELVDFSREKKIRFFLGRGSMFASGADQQFSDSYNVNTQYSATLSPKANNFSIQLLTSQYNNFMFGPEFEYKALELNQKMRDTTFLSNSYGSRNYTKLIQNSLGYRGQYLLNETNYLTFGASVGFGQYKTNTHTENASSSSIKVKKGNLILLNGSLGVGQVYKINQKLNLVLESSLTYMNGEPFGVKFQSHEFFSRIGFEFPFDF